MPTNARATNRLLSTQLRSVGWLAASRAFVVALMIAANP
jgi:hypothetical protein